MALGKGEEEEEEAATQDPRATTIAPSPRSSLSSQRKSSCRSLFSSSGKRRATRGAMDLNEGFAAFLTPPSPSFAPRPTATPVSTPAQATQRRGKKQQRRRPAPPLPPMHATRHEDEIVEADTWESSDEDDLHVHDSAEGESHAEGMYRVGVAAERACRSVSPQFAHTEGGKRRSRTKSRARTTRTRARMSEESMSQLEGLSHAEASPLQPQKRPKRGPENSEQTAEADAMHHDGDGDESEEGEDDTEEDALADITSYIDAVAARGSGSASERSPPKQHTQRRQSGLADGFQLLSTLPAHVDPIQERRSRGRREDSDGDDHVVEEELASAESESDDDEDANTNKRQEGSPVSGPPSAPRNPYSPTRRKYLPFDLERISQSNESTVLGLSERRNHAHTRSHGDHGLHVLARRTPPKQRGPLSFSSPRGAQHQQQVEWHPSDMLSLQPNKPSQGPSLSGLSQACPQTPHGAGRKTARRKLLGLQQLDGDGADDGGDETGGKRRESENADGLNAHQQQRHATKGTFMDGPVSLDRHDTVEDMSEDPSMEGHMRALARHDTVEEDESQDVLMLQRASAAEKASSRLEESAQGNPNTGVVGSPPRRNKKSRESMGSSLPFASLLTTPCKSTRENLNYLTSTGSHKKYRLIKGGFGDQMVQHLGFMASELSFWLHSQQKEQLVDEQSNHHVFRIGAEEICLRVEAEPQKMFGLTSCLCSVVYGEGAICASEKPRTCRLHLDAQQTNRMGADIAVGTFLQLQRPFSVDKVQSLFSVYGVLLVRRRNKSPSPEEVEAARCQADFSAFYGSISNSELNEEETVQESA